MTSDEIRRLRETLGLTQEEFAKKVGAGRATVARWESGQSKPTGLYSRALERLQATVKKSK
jgi:DNA-binding transcriptional regulator YiaG